jgi:adenylate cyclase
MDSWDWALDLVEDMNQIENWSYGRQLKFATEINRFFFTTYRNLSETLRTTETQVIDQYDLTLLGRKLIALFARKRYKLRLTPILTGKKLILKRCIFQYDRPKSGKKKWVLFDSSRYPAEIKKKDWRIYESESIVKSAAWLVNNGLYEFPVTAIEMKPNPSGVMLNDLVHLLKHLQAFLQPASHHFSDGLHMEEEAVKEKIMAVIDMEEITKFQKPKTIDLVYKNTWGEMFSETYPYQDGLRVLKKHVSDLQAEGPEENLSRIKVHIPESARETYFADQTYFHILKELGLSDITIPSDQNTFARTKQDAIFWTKADKGLKNKPVIQ